MMELMYLPTPILINDIPFFKYYMYSINNGILNKDHTYETCCAETKDREQRCNFTIRSDHHKLPHIHLWISIDENPYSRLPPLFLHNNNNNNNNNNFEKINLLNSIAMFFINSATANVNIEKPEFINMAFSIFKMFRNTDDDDKKFISIIQSFNRKKVSYQKKILAEKRLKELKKTLKRKICNLIMDSGSYGGMKQLVIKVARPVEKQMNSKKKLTIQFPPPSTSTTIINSPPSHKFIKFFSSNNEIIKKPYPKDIEYASPCDILLISNGDNILK
jgi:hypothetical protein